MGGPSPVCIKNRKNGIIPFSVAFTMPPASFALKTTGEGQTLPFWVEKKEGRAWPSPIVLAVLKTGREKGWTLTVCVEKTWKGSIFWIYFENLLFLFTLNDCWNTLQNTSTHFLPVALPQVQFKAGRCWLIFWNFFPEFFRIYWEAQMLHYHFASSHCLIIRGLDAPLSLHIFALSHLRGSECSNHAFSITSVYFALHLQIRPIRFKHISLKTG